MLETRCAMALFNIQASKVVDFGISRKRVSSKQPALALECSISVFWLVLSGDVHVRRII